MPETNSDGHELGRELAEALSDLRYEEARALVRRWGEGERTAESAYRDRPGATTEDFEAAEDCLLALAAGDPVRGYYRITDQRRGELGAALTLCLEAVARALRSGGEPLLAATAYSLLSATEEDDELEALLVELRLDRSALADDAARAGIDFWRARLLEAPEDAVGWTCLAEHAVTLGDASQARAAATRAIELTPELPDAHLLLADLLEDEGDAGAARELLERATARANDAAIWLALGEVDERLGELDAADEAFLRAIDLDARLWAPLEGRRRVLEASEDWEALAEHLGLMIERTNDFDQADLLRREQHRIYVERLGRGDEVPEERRRAAIRRRRAESELDRELERGLALAPPESKRSAHGSPLWVLAGIVLALAIVAALAAMR